LLDMRGFPFWFPGAERTLEGSPPVAVSRQFLGVDREQLREAKEN
jgi:hypothetical protein